MVTLFFDASSLSFISPRVTRIRSRGLIVLLLGYKRAACQLLPMSKHEGHV